MLDLQIDASKSFAWSNAPEGRKQIKDSGTIRKLYSGLGGHMNFSKLATNNTVQSKIGACSQFWSKLARSCAPISQKESALYVAAWSNLFYGVSTITLAKNHFMKLRTQATRALNVHQTGSSPMIQLSCVSNPCTDPELYCVLNSVLSFRDYSTPDMAQLTLRQIFCHGKYTSGPRKSLLQALETLSWSWIDGDQCRDQGGLPIWILRCPRSELSERVIVAWQQHVMGLASE